MYILGGVGGRVKCGVISDRKKGRSFVTFNLSFRVIRKEESKFSGHSGIIKQDVKFSQVFRAALWENKFFTAAPCPEMVSSGMCHLQKHFSRFIKILAAALSLLFTIHEVLID